MARKLIFSTLLIISLLAAYRPILAHADLVRARPAPGETVEDSPNSIHLVFSEPVRNASITLLYGSERQELMITESDTATIEGQIVDDLEEGTYQVLWSAFSEDGDEVSGSYSFGYDAPTSYTLPMIAGIALIVILFIGIWLGWKQRSSI
ncbi:MAG: copper resistance protein CopC [Anaerolineae bacterium]|nr:copper resistance protein CopC [Anaerolineae bacterium]